jgi:ribonuclease E
MQEQDGEAAALREAVHGLDREPFVAPELGSAAPAPAMHGSNGDAEAVEPGQALTSEVNGEAPAAAATDGAAEAPGASAGEEAGSGAEAPASPQAPEPAPVLTSTYDPTKAKRAGWWSKSRTG